ncbi:jg23989, partial [Pararge aegeria aegeria]
QYPIAVAVSSTGPRCPPLYSPIRLVRHPREDGTTDDDMAHRRSGRSEAAARGGAALTLTPLARYTSKPPVAAYKAPLRYRTDNH